MAHWPSVTAAHSHATESAGSTEPASPEFLTPDEVRVVAAIAAQIVPTDHTPGAREAGALYFIDRSLHTWLASGREDFRAGLGHFNDAFAATHSAADFAAADDAMQIEFLGSVDNTDFFATVRFLTLLGMFALASYGGNRDGIGWKLLGFQDTHAFSPPFGHYDRDYPGFSAPKAGS